MDGLDHFRINMLQNFIVNDGANYNSVPGMDPICRDRDRKKQGEFRE